MNTEESKKKAERKNIIAENRNKLEEVLPLDTPYSLMLDPCNLCNFKCKFCATQSEKSRNYERQLMEFDLYKKIIDDICQFPEKLKVLRLSGQGEPLLHPQYIEMIKYAKEKKVADYIETVTNGSRLNPELNQKLVDSGINRIRISIEAVDAQGYYDMAGVKIDFDKFVENIKDLYNRSNGKTEIYIKTVDAAVDTEEKRKIFYDTFENICHRIFIDNIIPLWSDFEEIFEVFDKKEEGIHGQKIKQVHICPYSFYNLLINSDGDVTVCCADWKRKLVVGNFHKESAIQIWNGTLLREFWKDMLKGKKSEYEMCRKCVLPMYDCNDNIDAFAEQILNRII